MKELNVNEIGFIYGQMKSLSAQYPTAKVLYNPEQGRVNVVFEPPKDTFQIQSISFSNEECPPQSS